MARSGLPSPSRSPKATTAGVAPVVKSTFGANDPAVILPAALMLRKTETILLPLLVTIRSGFPSPSTSPMATELGELPVEKLTGAASEVASITPLLGKVTTYGALAYAVSRLTVTE